MFFSSFLNRQPTHQVKLLRSFGSFTGKKTSSLLERSMADELPSKLKYVQAIVNV